MYSAKELKDCLVKGMFHLKTLQIHKITDFEMDDLINHYNGDQWHISMTLLIGKMKLEVVKFFLKQLKHVEKLLIKVFAEKVRWTPTYWYTLNRSKIGPGYFMPSKRDLHRSKYLFHVSQ